MSARDCRCRVPSAWVSAGVSEHASKRHRARSGTWRRMRRACGSRPTYSKRSGMAWQTHQPWEASAKRAEKVTVVALKEEMGGMEDEARAAEDGQGGDLADVADTGGGSGRRSAWRGGHLHTVHVLYTLAS